MTISYASARFAFLPRARPEVNGDVTYGDICITLDFLRMLAPGWRVLGTEWSCADPLQLIVVMQPDAI